jgi:hypothetical protein
MAKSGHVTLSTHRVHLKFGVQTSELVVERLHGTGFVCLDPIKFKPQAAGTHHHKCTVFELYAIDPNMIAVRVDIVVELYGWRVYRFGGDKSVSECTVRGGRRWPYLPSQLPTRRPKRRQHGSRYHRHR